METVYFLQLKILLIGVAFAVEVCYQNANKHTLFRTEDRR